MCYAQRCKMITSDLKMFGRGYSKLMEDSLHSRVNEAREALLIAKLNFRRVRHDRDADRELQAARELVMAKAQTRAMADVLNAVMELNAFVLNGAVPRAKSAR